MAHLVVYIVLQFLISVLFYSYINYKIEIRMNSVLVKNASIAAIVPILIFCLSNIFPIIGLKLSLFAAIWEEAIKYICIILLLRNGYSNLHAVSIAMTLGFTEASIIKPLMSIINYENVSIYIDHSLFPFILLSTSPLIMHTINCFVLIRGRGFSRILMLFVAIIIHFAFNETRGLYFNDIVPLINLRPLIIEMSMSLLLLYIFMVSTMDSREAPGDSDAKTAHRDRTGPLAR